MSRQKAFEYFNKCTLDNSLPNKRFKDADQTYRVCTENERFIYLTVIENDELDKETVLMTFYKKFSKKNAVDIKHDEVITEYKAFKEFARENDLISL